MIISVYIQWHLHNTLFSPKKSKNSTSVVVWVLYPFVEMETGYVKTIETDEQLHAELKEAGSKLVVVEFSALW